MSGFGCDTIAYIYVLPLFVTNISISICVWLVFAYSLNQIFRNQFQISLRIITTITTTALMITSTASTICTITFFVCPSTRWDNDFYLTLVIIALQTTALSLCMLQILFTVRFAHAFVDSSLQVSNRLKYTLYTFSFIEIIMYVAYTTFSVIYTFTDIRTFADYNISIICNFIMVLTYFVHFIVLMKNFISKLRQFAAICAQNNNNFDCNSNSNTKQDLEQINVHGLINRLFVCWMFAFISTVITYIVYVFLRFVFGTMGRLPQEYISTPLVFTVANIDSCVNLIALIFQFTFATKMYFKFCSKCDKKMKNCCDKCNKKSINNYNNAYTYDTQGGNRKMKTKDVVMMEMEIKESNRTTVHDHDKSDANSTRIESDGDNVQTSQKNIQPMAIGRIRTVSQT